MAIVALHEVKCPVDKVLTPDPFGLDVDPAQHEVKAEAAIRRLKLAASYSRSALALGSILSTGILCHIESSTNRCHRFLQRGWLDGNAVSGTCSSSCDKVSVDNTEKPSVPQEERPPTISVVSYYGGALYHNSHAKT